MAAAHRKRIEEFKSILAGPVIDLKKLRSLCFDGIPDSSSVRSLCWKILLNYLPLKVNDWPEFLVKQRLVYKQYIQEIIVNPSHTDGCSKQEVDHPLNLNPESQWNTFFKDNEVLLQIDRDVRRLCPDISFFQLATEYPITHFGYAKGLDTLRKRVDQAILESSEIGTNRVGVRNAALKKIRNEEYVVLPAGQEAHWEVVERILFIYAKLNPGVAYVQGMNEIMGPIYYLFASDPDPVWRANAEADSFFCFTHLMGEIRDNFIKSLDDSACGIGNMMKSLLDHLHKNDPELWADLEKKHMKPQFFAFRWLTLLLSQEFCLPDVIRLWDSLFADQNRFQFLIEVGCAMMILLRDRILKEEFPQTMKLLQNFPDDEFDMSQIIRFADKLRNQRRHSGSASPPTKTANETTKKAEPNKPTAARSLSLKERLSQMKINSGLSKT